MKGVKAPSSLSHTKLDTGIKGDINRTPKFLDRSGIIEQRENNNMNVFELSENTFVVGYLTDKKKKKRKIVNVILT